MVRYEWGETELREKLWLKGALEGEVKWRDGKERVEYTLYWRGSSDELYWSFCLAWMVPQRATSNQSPQSHSLTLLFFLSSSLLTLLISLPLSFFSLHLPPLLFLTPFLCLHPSHKRWSLPSQPIKLTAIIETVADPKLWPLVENVTYNACYVPLRTAQWSHSHSHTHIHAHTLKHLQFINMPQHDQISLTFGLYDSLPHKLYMK